MSLPDEGRWTGLGEDVDSARLHEIAAPRFYVASGKGSKGFGCGCGAASAGAT